MSMADDVIHHLFMICSHPPIMVCTSNKAIPDKPLIISMDWCKGTFTGLPHIWSENPWFAVILPLNQSIDNHGYLNGFTQYPFHPFPIWVLKLFFHITSWQCGKHNAINHPHSITISLAWVVLYLLPIVAIDIQCFNR